MKKSLIVFAVDFAFSVLCLFVAFLILFNYFVPYPFSLIVTISITIFFSLIAFKRLSSKRKASSLSRQEQALINSLKDYLSITKNSDVILRFIKSFEKKGFSPIRKKGYLYIPEKNLSVFFAFGFDDLKKSDVVRCFNLLNKKDCCVILTNSCPKEVLDFSFRFDNKINIMTADKVYEFLKSTDNLPPLNKQSPSSKTKEYLTGLWSKKRASKLFALGLTFLVLSFFVYTKIYYVIFGSFLMILSVISRLFGINSTKDNPKKLLD